MELGMWVKWKTKNIDFSLFNKHSYTLWTKDENRMQVRILREQSES